MERGSTVHSLWRAARDRLARLNAFLADGDSDEDTIFQARPREAKKADEADQRIAEAKKVRNRGASL